jgi:hypothetical protein
VPPSPRKTQELFGNHHLPGGKRVPTIPAKVKALEQK